LDDNQLLAAVRACDHTAAGVLYDRLHPGIEGTVRRLLGPDDEDREDCVQSAFVEIVRCIDGYRGESSLEHWAQRVTANVVYKHIRRRRLERVTFDRGSSVSDRPAPTNSGRRMGGQPTTARGTSVPASSSELAAQNALFRDALAKSREDPAAAVSMLDSFVRQYPNAPLEEAVLAKRLRLLAALGDPRAPSAAREYVTRYPNGFARHDAAPLLNEEATAR
jgi:RNA polymerase sigma factor (sigma-70 family)